jgi:hypothetical protein
MHPEYSLSSRTRTHSAVAALVLVLVLVLVLHGCAVTVSSTGAENQFQGDDNGHVGCPC